MTATGADLDAQALVASALEHCVFPLAPADDIAKDGVRMWVRGDGVRVTDAGGREYLDMMSSHARANSLGYGNAEIADAVAAQLKTMHYAGTVNNMAPPTVKLADKIVELTPEGLSKVVFVSGGSEAVESAIKIAKQYQIHAGKPRAFKIISRWNAYHGATMGALGATDWLGTRHISEPGGRPSARRSRDAWRRRGMVSNQSPGFSRPQATAACRLGAVVKVMNWCVRIRLRARAGAAQRKPTFQPVRPNILPAEPIFTVRSRMPGHAISGR